MFGAQLRAGPPPNRRARGRYYRLVSPLAKYAFMVNEPNDIACHLAKAAYLASAGRPGPVWLDIPLDVQGVTIVPE